MHPSIANRRSSELFPCHSNQNSASPFSAPASWARRTRTPTARRRISTTSRTRVRRKLVCDRRSRPRGHGERWEWESTATDWRAAIERKRHRRGRHRAAEPPARPGGDRGGQAGKIVLCEKPMALTVDEAQAMADAARGVPTKVWYNYRRVPGDRLREAADRGRPARDHLPLQRRLSGSSGAPTRRARRPGGWIRRWLDRAWRAIC